MVAGKNFFSYKIKDFPVSCGSRFNISKQFSIAWSKIRGWAVCQGLPTQPWIFFKFVFFQLQNGCLRIIDRKKHLFKLSHVSIYFCSAFLQFLCKMGIFPKGEYISPEKIESVYSRSLFVEQIFVDGDSLRVILALTNALFRSEKKTIPSL